MFNMTELFSWQRDIVHFLLFDHSLFKFLCFQIIYFQKIVIHFYHHHLAGLHALVKSKVVISIFGKKLRYSSMAAISSLSNSGIVKSFFLIYFTTSATNAMTTLSL